MKHKDQDEGDFDSGKLKVAQRTATGSELQLSPMYGIIADIVKNNHDLTDELQNAIAVFIEHESYPVMSIAAPVQLSTSLDLDGTESCNCRFGLIDPMCEVHHVTA